DAKTLSDATKPGFNGSGDRLNLETNTNMSSISVGRRYSVVNNLEIFLPANASLDLNTRRGSIVIRTRTGAVKASTMRGDITVQDVKGNTELRTRHGDVRVQNVSGDLRVQTSNGTVDIHASKLPLGNMEINDHRGEVQVSVPARANFYLQATATRGEIQSDFTGVNVMNQSRVSTATGNIGSGGP